MSIELDAVAAPTIDDEALECAAGSECLGTGGPSCWPKVIYC